MQQLFHLSRVWLICSICGRESYIFHQSLFIRKQQNVEQGRRQAMRLNCRDKFDHDWWSDWYDRIADNLINLFNNIPCQIKKNDYNAHLIHKGR